MSEAMPSFADRAAMIEVGVASLAGEVLERRAIEDVRSSIASELASAFDRCTDLADAERRLNWIGTGGVEDYLDKVVTLHDGSRLLCGIRFEGGDETKPFIELVASTSPVADWHAAASAAVDCFEVFGCDRVQMFTSGTASQVPGATGDLLLVTSTLSSVAGVAEGVVLEDARVDEAAPFVLKRYKALAEARPVIAELVYPATPHELVDCRDDGRLCWWNVAGRRAGLIGVRRGEQHGLRGFEMVEEIVSADFVGRGTARHAQRALAALLVDAGEDPSLDLHGTISFDNPASRRTAEAAGRNAVASWWFFRSSSRSSLRSTDGSVAEAADALAGD